MISIKFLPTGHVFSLPESEVQRLIFEDPENYLVIRPSKKSRATKKSSKQSLLNPTPSSVLDINNSPSPSSSPSSSVINSSPDSLLPLSSPVYAQIVRN